MTQDEQVIDNTVPEVAPEATEPVATETPAETQETQPEQQEQATQQAQPPEDVLEIEGEKLTKAELAQRLKDWKNNQDWKAKNAERGRELNAALEIEKRRKTDPEFDAYLKGYKPPELRKFEEVYDPEVADQLYRLKTENETLKRSQWQKEQENAYISEEKELLALGIPEEALAKAYDVVTEYNDIYMPKHGRPMPLKHAVGILQANGNLNDVWKRKEQEIATKVTNEFKQGKKLPKAVGSSTVPTESATKISKDAPRSEILKKLGTNPLFKDVPDR